MASARHRLVGLSWLALGTALVLWVAGLGVMSPAFGYDTEVVDMPIIGLVAALMIAGLVYVLAVPRLIETTLPHGPSSERAALFWMVAAGLAARLLFFGSEPMLEDDYQRYLWDGAVTANGHDPYRHAPKAILDSGADHPLAALAARSDPVLGRVGHGQLTTIYPPLTQAVFAFAYWLAPFELDAWRAVLLAFDVATLALLISALRSAGIPPLWAALYWLNPLVIRQLFNTAHMDGLVSPFVLAALLLSARRPMLATAAVGIAFGLKFWPVLLLPLVLRHLFGDPLRLATCLAIFSSFAVLALWPQISAGLTSSAGVVAYAASWSRNSALYPLLESASALAVGRTHAALLTRGLLAIALVGFIAALAWTPIRSFADLARRATLATGALLLLSPAQYPWYALWQAPLLPLHPIPGFLILPVVLPLYELFFYFAARDDVATFAHGIVWVIWLPVWLALARDQLNGRLIRK